MADGGPEATESHLQPGTRPAAGAARAVAIASCPEPLPAHERSGDRAVNVIGWAIDEAGGIQAVCVRADGSVHLVGRESILFDHAVRPTDY